MLFNKIKVPRRLNKHIFKMPFSFINLKNNFFENIKSAEIVTFSD